MPLRANIRHGYCYKLKDSGRDTEPSTGIDFTKAVVIGDERHIGEEATIGNKEYVELKSKFHFVVRNPDATSQAT